MNEYDSNRIYDIVKKNNYLKTQNIKDADCYIKHLSYKGKSHRKSLSRSW